MSDSNASKVKRTQPPWDPPVCEKSPKLHLFNSLTRQKEPFVPQNGKQVLWYSCGPTVYDASHMGHARSYISFDIVRRTLQDYFGYDVLYCMNITDIDDKIIMRARQYYLFDKYCDEGHHLEKIMQDLDKAYEPFLEKLKLEQDPDKRVMLEKTNNKVGSAIDNVKMVLKSGPSQRELASARQRLLDDSKDVYCKWLDNAFGSTITDNSIFSKLPRHWEEKFHEDMDGLNVRPADVLTRVSEYIPEIIKYVQKIIDNGFGYEAGGSVYFTTKSFDNSKGHFYAKLVPEAYGDNEALKEGEGDLSVSDDALNSKKDATDFALWKASKPGEPAWDSPWGKGRPGWHIECSVMASAILGESMDIHSGGVDLKFPHHDNEIAQAEAYYGNDNWVRYFLHSGHLTISGCKMSKSLKNFITIQEALKKYTSRQIRLMFLLHSWKDTLDFSSTTMDIALQYEKFVGEFFMTVKDILRGFPSTGVEAFKKWNEEEVIFNKKFMETKDNVHLALCDNIDTRSALENIRNLITIGNSYIAKCRTEKKTVNQTLLLNSAIYVSKIFKVFGAIEVEEPIGLNQGAGGSSINLEEAVIPYLEALANFRESVRQISREQKVNEILKLSDDLRDNVLPNLGVRLEDHDGLPCVIKLADKATLLREREERLKEEESKQLAKEADKKKKEAAQADKDSQNQIPPSELFKKETEKYSKFDDRGVPTHDAKGEELPKSAMKKLNKLYEAHDKKYKKFIDSQKG